MTGASKIFFNMHAGWSASDFVDDFFFIAYATLLTQYFFYLWSEMSVSNLRYSANESLLNFKMSENYAMIRATFIKRLKGRFVYFIVFTYWASFWCFYVNMTVLNGPVDKYGHTLNQLDMGFASYSCFVFLVHTLFIF